MAATGNKAYATIASFGVVAGGPGVFANFIVLTPDDTVVPGLNQSTGATFGYGDSDEAIREALVSAIRNSAQDPNLDVNFLG